jgi:hypothetical protein
LFSSTAFEIEIAALHVGIGRHVEFLREGPQKTPDLLVDSEIEIECKSVRQLTQRDQNNREMWSQLERKLWNATRGDSGWYVEFETEDVVRQEDLAWVLEQLGKAQEQPSLEIREENRRVRITKLTPASSEFGIQWAPPLEQFDVGAVEMTAQLRDGALAPHSAYIFAFRTTKRPDWATRAHKLLKEARQQFSRTRPAVVFVEIPLIDKNTSPGFKRRVADAVKELFRQSRTVSAVVAVLCNDRGNRRGRRPKEELRK